MRCLIKSFGWWVAVLCIVALTISIPQASAAGGRAGLIVAHGDGRMAYVVVELSTESLSGVELLDRSGLLVTEVSFGGLGVGVCAIDATGCDIGECRKRVCQGPQPGDPYWQYFVAGTTGSWQASPLGVSGDTVRDGDVRVFIWSNEQPVLAVLTVEDVAAKAGPANESGVALQRYAADGSVDTGQGGGEEQSFPVEGLAAVALALVVAGGIVVRQRIAGREA